MTIIKTFRVSLSGTETTLRCTPYESIFFYTKQRDPGHHGLNPPPLAMVTGLFLWKNKYSWEATNRGCRRAQANMLGFQRHGSPRWPHSGLTFRTRRPGQVTMLTPPPPGHPGQQGL